VAAEGKRMLVPAAASKRMRCAIYTRKSTEEGLDQEFNSLDAQREAGEAYVTSQRHDGWIVSPERYDDGGFTGANMERPALKRLLVDVQSGRVNCIVVYKVDRFSRSLLDFMKMMEILDKRGVTFVSVTQPFNTTTSPGRLLVNMLFSFAQFEREMISERTRDKMGAARRKGKWIGGNLVLGYDLSPKGGALVVNRKEAERVREIFRLYLELGSLIPLVAELERRAWKMKAWTTREGRETGGARFTKTTLYNLLTNVIYTGRVKYEGKLYGAEHERIIDDDIWNRVQEQLNRNGRRGGRNVRNKCGALLKGLVRCATCNCGMVHTYTQKSKALYRYYVCVNAQQRGWNKCQTRSVSAPLLEDAVVDQIRGFAQRPEMLSEVLRLLEENRQQNGPTSPMVEPGDVRDALLRFDPLWNQLNGGEQERLIRALVKEVRYDGPSQTVTVSFLSEGIRELCQGDKTLMEESNNEELKCV
jgi:site-specific DNA recombinase